MYLLPVLREPLWSGVVEPDPDPDPPGSEIIVKIIMCPSLELTLHYKLNIPLSNCPIFINPFC
jgi:hypothetical protein